jgi:hypothetical protein
MGFRLMVTAKGYRAYYLIYKPRGVSQARAHQIGPAEDLSYKEAKSKAETIRGLVAAGKDPVGDEQAARARKQSSRVVTLAHYDHSKRIPERADWLRLWGDHVADCAGLSAPMKAPSANHLLHLYATPTGLPEIKATNEPANGRRYLGAFTPMEAARKVQGMAREFSAATKRAGGRQPRTRRATSTGRPSGHVIAKAFPVRNGGASAPRWRVAAKRVGRSP